MKKELSFLCVWPLPAALTLPERTDLLHQFGAVYVQHITRRGKVQAAKAGFNTFSDCQIAVSRLHQLDLLGNRLHAVLWDQSHKNPLSGISDSSSDQTELSVLQQQQAQLTALSSQLGLLQPLPPHARYSYPEPSPKIIANIANALVAVPKFYTQVLHLMNKMNLPEPFSAALPPSELVRQTADHITTLRPDGGCSDATVLGTKEQPVKGSDDGSKKKESILFCNACKKILKKVDFVMGDNPVVIATEKLQEDVLTSSSTSESELESDHEQQTMERYKSSLSLEHVQAIKRSRKPPNTHAAGSRKIARLQLGQEKKFLQHDSVQPKSFIDKCSAASVSDAFRMSVAPVGQLVKLQMNIPMSLSVTTDKEPLVTRTVPDDSIVQVQEQDVRLKEARRRDLSEECDGGFLISREHDKEQSNTDRVESSASQAASGFGKLEAKKASEGPSKQTLSTKYISLEELENNRVKISEYPVVPVLANYSPGSPSSRLYIKNLAKSVTEQHLRRLYDRYAYTFYEKYERRHDEPLDIMANPDKYHVRVLQEGRMKGQAFVTLPTVELAEEARQHTNGFIMLDKPMVVAFARVKTGPS